MAATVCCPKLLLTLVLLYGCITSSHSQLTVLTGPEALVSSSGSVVEESVIQIYCTVEDDTTVTFTWTLNGSSLLNDPPHIRIREDNRPERSASLLTDDSTSVLTVDSFGVSDDGVYQCTATSGATSGNGTAVTLTAMSSTADGALMLTDQPSLNEPVDLRASLDDNRTGIALGDTVDGSILICIAGHQGDGALNYPSPSVVWVRSGQVVDDTDSRITITSTTMTNGQVTSSLTITNFGLPDAGVYQCVITDDSDGGEVITSIPYQLDTGLTIRIERVSPEIIILRPPEKLVIEVRVSGEYEVLFWYKGTSATFIPGGIFPQEFPNYFETFVRDITTAGDEGIYVIQPQFKTGTSQSHVITPTGGIDFGVIAPVDATTSSLSTSTVVIPEGHSADISCRSVGAPVPSITWEVNNQTTDFEQTDTETPFVATLTGTIGNRGFDVIPGNIESSLHIVSATYPDHDGVYTCIGTNSDDLTIASSSVFITVQVNVIPEVEINTTDTLVVIGNDVTITCSVLKGNPSNYIYTIINVNTTSTTTGSTRTLSDIQMADVGTYRCDVTNDAGTGASNTVTIELGDPPVVTTIQPDPVILNTAVDLVCVVTGDTPIEIVWERFNVTSTIEVVYTGNDATGGNFSLIASTDNYGMYRCAATSRFGMNSSSINIIQAVGPTLPADGDSEVVAGSTLTLTVTITDFNLPLTDITWFIDGVPASAVTGRTGVLTITNTSTTSPPATTTLTLDPVQLPSESGLYSVTAVNPAGNDTTTFNVTVSAPVNIIFPADLVYLIVPEGNQTTLTCTARGSPAPVFVWYMGSEVVDIADARLLISAMEMSNVTTGFIDVTSLLNITQVDRTDSGVFRCEASNTILGALSTDSQCYNLTVNFSPTILEDPVPVSVFAPTTLTLTCTAEGYPRPTIVWTKTSPNGEVAEFSLPRDIFNLTETANGLNVTSNLTILETSELNTGNWSCRANNSLGEAVSQQAEVVIYFGAQIVSPMGGEVFRVNETENITFTCVAIGLPPPTISFFNRDLLLGPPRFVVETQPAELLPNTTFLVTASLTLINAMDGDSSDEGICRAVNIVEELNETRMDEVNIVVVVNVAPSITVPPMDVSMVSPDRALFSCTADSVPIPTIFWLRMDNGTEIDVIADSTVQISNTPIDNRTVMSNLIFNETQPVRSGVYICVASNLLGSATEMAQLTVNDLPQIITPVMNFTYTVNEENPVTFNCSASGIPAPTIGWFRVDQNGSATDITDARFSISPSQVDNNYELSDSRGTVFLVTSQLTVSTTQDEDSGQYQCQAENDVGNTTREFELVVQIAPDITMDPDDIVVTEGMSAPFLCAATGRPRPRITWYRDGTNDSLLAVNVSDPRVIVTETQMGRELVSNFTINNVLPSDSDVYRCIAENDVNSDMNNNNATLTVNVLPVVTSVYPEVGQTNYTTVNETDSIIFECTATGIPAPDIDLDFGDITARVDVRESSLPVEVTRNQDGEIVYQVTRTAMINRTMDSDSGVYMCRANNDVGMDQESFELIVQVSPTITQSPVDVTIIEGNNAVFVCQASALPRPAVNWDYYDPVSNSTSRVMDDADYEIMETMEGDRVLMSTLTVLSTDASDFGEYRCTAINVVGMVSATASLSVHIRPLITSLDPGDMLVVNQTNSATFVCTATGLPTPLVQWYRGDLLLNGTGMDINSRVELNNTMMDGTQGQISTVISIITITDTIGDDSDTYSCVASNVLINIDAMEDGRDQQNVTLFVQVPPDVLSLTVNQRITANESESATLTFSIENASPVVMVSNIRWYYSADFASSLFASGAEFQDITTLTNRTSQSTLTFSNDRLSLTIDNIVQARMAGDETDAGRYFLQATNEAGDDNSYIDIVVEGPPIIIDPPMDQVVINNGSSAVFSCDALASPDHTVSWTFTNFNGTVIDIVSNIKYKIVGNGSRFGELTVTNVDYEDRGVYTCSPANSIGTVTASANLTVHVTPMIVDTSALTEVRLGVPVVLVCLVTGFPIPSISWRRDGEIINIYSDASLTARLDVVEFAVVAMDMNISTNFESSGYTGSGSIMGLLMMYTDVTVDQVRQLGELGVVGLLSFEKTLREDTGDYTCTATNVLPETTTLRDVSNNIPLFILERPDSPANVSTRNIGARWVVLRWTPSFDGNRPVTNFSLYIRSVDVSNSFTLISTLIPSNVMSSAGELMYNVSMQGVILPYTNYSFAVDTCNNIGCSNQSDPSPVVTTDQDASSPPTGLTAEPTETTITLTWTEPDMPNGVITHYGVSFVGTRDYDASFNDHTDTMQLPVGDIYSPAANNFGTTLTGLFPNTLYTVSVFTVNGAGNGMTNTTTVNTLNAPPLPPVVNPSSVSGEEVINNNPQTVTIGVVSFSEDNVLITHYQVIVVFLPEGTAISDLDSDSKLAFPQGDLGTYADLSCNSKPSSPYAYVTAEMSGDLYKGLTGDKFVVGQDKDDDINSPNDRPNSYTNGPLCFATSYTFFVRAFSASGSNQMGRRAVRQADPDNRQYVDFASSGYVQSTAEIPAAPVDSTPIIAAIIVVVLVIIVIVVVVVVIVIFVRRGRTYEYKTKDETDNGNGVETLKLTDYRPPDEGSLVRHPIPLSVLPSHCDRMRTNENCGFGEEYRIIQEKSPKKAVDICTTPDNKPRNRYANIQCFDETRVVLTAIEGAEHDYINANFIAGYNRPREYIAAQGPLPDTLGDFWRMVWDYDIPTIVMLTNLVEKMKIKCSQYWPNAAHQQYANIDVSLVNTVTQSDFVIRHFHIKHINSDVAKEVRQFHFVSWPDFGVPRHPTPLLHFLRRVRNMHSYENEKPLLVHCSAGVGRTGTMLTIDVELQRSIQEGVVDPFNYVTKLRDQRNHMVQTEAQYVFLHDAIMEGITSGATEIRVEKLGQKFAELEQADAEGETGFQKEYGRLRQFKVDVKEFTDANDDANKFKNRISNALPYNYNRVHLQMSPGVGGSDYINASYIDGYSNKGTYIATQGPLLNTVNDFWRLVWEKEVHVIVMLTQLEEKGKEQCAQYWPESVNSPEKMGSLTIELVNSKQYEDYILRELKVSDVTATDGKSRTLKQYHFIAWPAEGAPMSGAGMIDLIDQVNRTQSHTGNKPILVHCSAGIGRTGAFCALSTSIDRVKTEGLVDVFHCVKHLRTQRPHMVQSVEQYAFCYVAIREYVESLSSYSNFQ